PSGNGAGLIAAVFVSIARNRIAGVGGVHAVEINLDRAGVAIDEAYDAFGVVVKRTVGLVRPAVVPGERRVGDPFHDEQRLARVGDGGDVPPGDVGHAGQIDAVEIVAAVGKLLALAK